MKSIAILYQAKPPPLIEGLVKPYKEGGYSDSGADIGYALKSMSNNPVTPVNTPDPYNRTEWVFPDTYEGIKQSVHLGAEVLWLNTLLYKRHPIEEFFNADLEFIGQYPAMVDQFDNKWFTNRFLANLKLPVPKAHSFLISDQIEEDLKINFPLVIKPKRGRGSQGVKKVSDINELKTIKKLF